MTHDELVAELFAHAARLGVETGYWDVRGNWHTASLDSIIAVLIAMGAPITGLDDASGSLRRHMLSLETRVLAPVVTVVGNAPLAFDLCLPEGTEPWSARIEVRFEDGGARVSEVRITDLEVVGGVEDGGRRWVRRRVELSPAVLGRDRLEMGYHTLSVELREQRHEAALLVAPDHVVQPAEADRLWGVFAPAYSLRTELGIGADVMDLDVLGAWIDGYGGKVVGTLPLLASYLDRPCEPSPYSPVSRRFWNEVYLDVERLPEMARSSAARARLDDPGTQAEIAAMRRDRKFDAARQCRLVTALLDELTTTFFAQPVSERADFDRWVADNPLVIEYGRFRAAVERRGAGWHGVGGDLARRACSWPTTSIAGSRPATSMRSGRCIASSARCPALSPPGTRCSTSTCRWGRAAKGSTRGSTSTPTDGVRRWAHLPTTSSPAARTGASHRCAPTSLVTRAIACWPSACVITWARPVCCASTT